MAHVRIELNSKGVLELLRSKEVAADLDRRARRIAAAAGPGHEVNTAIGKNRGRSEVVTATTEARLAEAKNRRLSKAIDAGRG